MRDGLEIYVISLWSLKLLSLRRQIETDCRWVNVAENAKEIIQSAYKRQSRLDIIKLKSELDGRNMLRSREHGIISVRHSISHIIDSTFERVCASYWKVHDLHWNVEINVVIIFDKVEHIKLYINILIV